LKNKSQAQGGNGRHTHTLWDALKPNFAQAATRGEGGVKQKKNPKGTWTQMTSIQK